ncbi:hypothetical protein Dimus_005388, partial [Dionaea muscipula]
PAAHQDAREYEASQLPACIQHSIHRPTNAHEQQRLRRSHALYLRRNQLRPPTLPMPEAPAATSCELAGVGSSSTTRPAALRRASMSRMFSRACEQHDGLLSILPHGQQHAAARNMGNQGFTRPAGSYYAVWPSEDHTRTTTSA